MNTQIVEKITHGLLNGDEFKVALYVIVKHCHVQPKGVNQVLTSEADPRLLELKETQEWLRKEIEKSQKRFFESEPLSLLM